MEEIVQQYRKRAAWSLCFGLVSTVLLAPFYLARYTHGEHTAWVVLFFWMNAFAGPLNLYNYLAARKFIGAYERLKRFAKDHGVEL